MAEEVTTADPAGSDPDAEHALAAPPETDHERHAALHAELHALRERLAHFETGAAGRYWAHLSTADFMNSSFAFAALAVLSAFPFLAVTSTVIGGDIRRAIVARMGLNAEATADVNNLI